MRAGRRAGPRLVVVTVTYNSAEALPGLLDSLGPGLAGAGPAEIVVVDNASSDASTAIAARHPLRPRLVETGRNGGYAAGINAGAALAPEDADLLVLNPDIRLAPGAAARLLAHLRNPAVGLAAPRILNEDGTLFRSLRREPSLLTAWADALFPGRLGALCDLGEIVHDHAAYERESSVDWASGAALAISAGARAAIGPWDESFFLYSEEVDYQRRARALGFKVAYVPEAVMVHMGGEYRRNPKLYALLTENRIRHYARHHGPAATALFRIAIMAGEVLRSPIGQGVHRAGLAAAVRAPRQVH